MYQMNKMCSKERAEGHRWTQKNTTRNFWFSFHMKFCSDLTNQTNLTRSCIKSVTACCLVFLCDITILSLQIYVVPQFVMRMLSSISHKKNDEFLLPETIETPMENQKDPGTGVKITSTMTKTKKKKFLKSFLCGASSVLRLVLFGVLYLAPGILLTVLLSIFLF